MVGNATCFPLWSNPDESKVNGPIVVACLNEDHLINLTLHESYPIPTNHMQWRMHKSEIPSALEYLFMSTTHIC